MPKTTKSTIRDFLELHKEDLGEKYQLMIDALEKDYPEQKRGPKSSKEHPAQLGDNNMFEAEDGIGGIFEDYSMMPDFLNILGETPEEHLKLAICLDELGLLPLKPLQAVYDFMSQYVEMGTDRNFRYHWSEYKNNPDKYYPEEEKEKDKESVLVAIEELRHILSDYLNEIRSEYEF